MQSHREFTIALYIAVGIFFIAGLIAGYGWGARDKSELPDCKEDEYYYPEDFTGENEVADLVCVHVDEIKGNE